MASISQQIGAVADLGMGQGAQLGQQVQDETDEERKKRLAQLAQQQSQGPTTQLASATLFGGGGSYGL